MNAEIEAGNSRARRHSQFEYWSCEITAEKLRGAPERLVEHPAGNWPAWKSIEIQVDGKWYRLGSTDLMDDVRISGSIPLAPMPGDVAIVCRTARYGARVTPEAIYLINAWSDG